MNKINLSEVVSFMDEGAIFKIRNWFNNNSDMNDYARFHNGKYIYKDGKIKTIIRPFKNKIAFSYNNEGNLDKIMNYNNKMKMEFQYNENGNFSKIILPMLDISFEYAKTVYMTRILTTIYVTFKTADNKPRYYIFRYNHLGLLVDINYNEGKIEFKYNEKNQLIEAKTNLINIKYAYNYNGGLIYRYLSKECKNEIYKKYISKYYYNKNGQLTEIDNNNEYNEKFYYDEDTANLTCVLSPLTEDYYKLESNNQLLTIDGDFKTIVVYDHKMRITSIYNIDKNQNLGANVRYKFDDDGNIIKTVGRDLEDLPFSSVDSFRKLTEKNTDLINRDIIKEDINELNEVYIYGRFSN